MIRFTLITGLGLLGAEVLRRVVEQPMISVGRRLTAECPRPTQQLGLKPQAGKRARVNPKTSVPRTRVAEVDPRLPHPTGGTEGERADCRDW